MRLLVSLLSLGVLIGMAGCDAGQVEDLFGEADGLRNIVAPATVEVYRVEPHAAADGDTREQVAGFPVIAGPVELDEATARELSAVLADANSYAWDLASGCEFVPGVAARFTRSGDVTDVLFCFQCDVLVAYRSGTRAGGADFSPSRRRFVRVFQQIFPDDEAIQQLK